MSQTYEDRPTLAAWNAMASPWEKTPYRPVCRVCGRYARWAISHARSFLMTINAFRQISSALSMHLRTVYQP